MFRPSAAILPGAPRSGRPRAPGSRSASADLFIAPCPIETFGLAALEALASGLTLVGANQGGVGDLLHDAPAARTFDAGDPADLRRAVAAQLAASHDSPALWVAERFSRDRTFETLFALYAGLGGRGAPLLSVAPRGGAGSRTPASSEG